VKQSAASLVSALVLGVLMLPACSGGGSDIIDPGVTRKGALLHYDGVQVNSPNLPGNTTYEAAARFTPATLGGLANGDLVKVLFHISTPPDNCKVKVYGPGTADTPGSLLYSADVTTSVVGASWNSHVLANPVRVPNGDLWISIEFTDATMQRTIGCDSGPAVPDGNWLFDSGNGSWAPFFVSVNWNVRAAIDVTH